MAENSPIYLDYNATVPVRPEVIERVCDVMREGGNPSSVHAYGRKAKARLETARAEIASAINCRSQMIIFTSGGTEANNMAVLSSGRKKLVTTNVEHDSIRMVADRFAGDVAVVPVDSAGALDINILRNYLNNNSQDTVISLLYANNETGVIQNLETIVEIAHEAGALVHIDAIQAFSKVSVDFMKMGVDMMSISAHKIGGPQGVGALIAREKLPISPMLLGGGQETGRRGGTENIAGISGFGLAASMIQKSLEKMKTVRLWRDEIEQKIAAHCAKAMFLGQKSMRLPNVSSIYMPGVASETQVMNFDLNNICISAGSACSSGKVKASHVALAMTGSDEIASSTIRMSLGWGSEYSDAEAFVECWKKLYDKKHA